MFTGEVQPTLTDATAVELCTAWAQEVARRHGIRLIVLKGKTLVEFGLRDPEYVSADVDVLVDPARFDDYLTAIRDAGWNRMPPTFQSENFSTHSVTFVRDGWPISFDVHRHFPGFLRAPEVVFDELWERRIQLMFAHRVCDVPDRASTIAIVALHALRSNAENPRHGSELEAVRSLDLDDDQRSRLASLVDATGSAAPLRSVLSDLGVHVEPTAADLASPDWRMWQWKVVGARGGVTDATAGAFLGLLQVSPWRRKPAVLGRAIWPTRANILHDNPDVGTGLWPVLGARVRRWGRGLRALPRVLRQHSARR